MCSWQNFPEKVIDDFKNNGYKSNNIEEMNIITIFKKVDMSYDFYIKHNMHAVEWKLKAMNNRNKNLINNSNRKWRHPLIKKFQYVSTSN